MSAAAVVESYLRACTAGDLERVEEHLSPDVLKVTAEATFSGRAAVMSEVAEMLQGMFAPGTYSRTTDSLTAEGDLVLLVWHAACLGTVVVRAASMFVVRNDRISRLASAGWTDPV